MRHVIALLALAVLSGSGARAEVSTGSPATDLTIVLKFDGPRSDKSITEMKRELESIMKDSGRHLNWRLREDVEGESFPDLVVVRFKGKCLMEPAPFLYDERGPLAFTYTSGDTILPYSEVECDKVRVSIRSAMWGADYNRGDLLMGRALGRVLAHELYHIMGQTAAHRPIGVARHALSGSQLISDKLGFEPDEMDALQRNQQVHTR